MDWKTLVALVALSPVVALGIGVGVLAAKIGETWSPETTAGLVTGLITVCGGGTVVIALIFSLVIGLPLAARFLDRRDVARYPAPTVRMIDPGRPTWREPSPPQLADKGVGSWQTGGGAVYDLWPEGEPVDVYARWGERT